MQQARTYRTHIGTVTHAPLPSSELLNYPDFSCSEDAVLHDRNHYVRTRTPGGNDSACALAVPEETRAMVQPTQASAPTYVPESAHNLVSYAQTEIDTAKLSAAQLFPNTRSFVPLEGLRKFRTHMWEPKIAPKSRNTLHSQRNGR